jgi:hypothetical protein
VLWGVALGDVEIRILDSTDAPGAICLCLMWWRGERIRDNPDPSSSPALPAYVPTEVKGRKSVYVGRVVRILGEAEDYFKSF